MKNVLTQFGAALIMLMVLLVPRGTWAQEQQNGRFSIGLTAGPTTWDTGFDDLQTPGWPEHLGGHVVGEVELQYKYRNFGIFASLAADPHRWGENRAAMAGVRHDIVSYKRLHFYGQASVGILEAPSFLEYCGSYEYRKGDCHASASHTVETYVGWGGGVREVDVTTPGSSPEFCNWINLSAGFGVRLDLSKHFDLELARGTYEAVYAISPRFAFRTGFRIKL